MQNSQLSKVTDEDDNKDTVYDRGLDSSQQARVAQSLQAHDYVRLAQSFSDWRPTHIKNVNTSHKERNYPTKTRLIPVLQAGTMVMIPEPVSVNKEVHPLTAAHRPRPAPAAKKSKEPAKPPQDPEAVFPCKKCGRYG